jgi:hypothetical protein
MPHELAHASLALPSHRILTTEAKWIMDAEEHNAKLALIRSVD